MRSPPTARPAIGGPMRAGSEPRPGLRAATGRRPPTVHGGRREPSVGLTGALAALVLIATLGVAAAQPADPIAIPLDEASPLDTSRPPLEGDWVVVAATGAATWRPQGGGRWQPIAVGRVLPAPSEIETGPTGGVTLVLGGDRLVVASNSRLILMARGRGEDQRLRQERGRLRVDIERRPGRTVEVRTPLLSLGIKGTSFEVAVDPWQSSILVLEGQVTVSTPNGAPVQLGPREGLSQPADPNRPARPLTLTDPAPVSRTGPVRWHLSVPDAPAPISPSVFTGADPSTEGAPGSAALRASGTIVLGTPATPGRPPAQTGLGAWLDDRSVLLLVLVVGAGLVLLIVPGLVLGQSLREHWLDRPTGKGKRRRSLIRGW